MNKLIAIVVTLAIGVIMVGSLLSPVISDASQSMEKVTETQANVNTRMSAADSFTFTWDASDYLISINGTDMPDLERSKMLLVSDKMQIVTSKISDHICMAIWTDGMASNTISSITYDISITLADGVITFVHGSPATTDTIENVTYAYVYDENGDYASINNGYLTSVKANTGTKVVLYQMGGWWGETYAPVEITADPSEITTSMKKYAASGTVGTDTDVTITFEKNDYDELTLISCSPQIAAAVVPYKYTGYESSPLSDLLNSIVIIVIVALVIAAVGIVMVRRE